MRPILANLTAALLLLQAASGGCWQRPEGCEDVASSRALVDSGCNDSCSHCPLGLPSDESQEPCDCESECHGVCNYTLPEHVPSEGLGKAWVSVAADVDLGFLASVRTSIAARQHDFGRPTPFSPHRLHLLHQVILI